MSAASESTGSRGGLSAYLRASCCGGRCGGLAALTLGGELGRGLRVQLGRQRLELRPVC